jgi:MSHA biogenesis protein MshL
MKFHVPALMTFLIAACAAPPPAPNRVDPQILAGLNRPAERSVPADTQPVSVQEALLPPLRVESQRILSAPVEPRFDLVVASAAAQQVFMSIVSGTRYSMLVHPDVVGSLSLNLKDVTVREALNSIRDMHGYEYQIDGTRIFVRPAGLQTRVFQVNYLMGLRAGRSDVRVSSGAITGNFSGSNAPAAAPAIAAAAAAATGGAGIGPAPTPIGAVGSAALAGTVSDSSRVSTVTQSDFWNEIYSAMRALVGNGEGRNVVVSPQSGVVVIRAMPEEIRSVENYLRAMRVSVERQVMIEAKVIDVTLSNAYQAGVNWAAFPTNGLTAAQVGSNVGLNTTGALTGGGAAFTPAQRALATTTLGAGLAGTAISAGGAVGAGVFGLALQTQNFAALLQFLESQGTVQVLSSPRIAALNNQKAVLKVGRDEFFVTNVTTTTLTNTVGAVAGVQLSPTLSSFFSGVSLDITPQIDDEGNITLHIHPLVSNVENGSLNFNFGTGLGAQNLQVAKSTINESDTIVRVQDGNIVALGGLMQTDLAADRSGLPGLQSDPVVGGAFRNNTNTNRKRELIILLKPTVIRSDRDWDPDLQQARERLQSYGNESSTSRPAVQGR